MGALMLRYGMLVPFVVIGVAYAQDQPEPAKDSAAGLDGKPAAGNQERASKTKAGTGEGAAKRIQKKSKTTVR